MVKANFPVLDDWRWTPHISDLGLTYTGYFYTKDAMPINTPKSTKPCIHLYSSYEHSKSRDIKKLETSPVPFKALNKKFNKNRLIVQVLERSEWKIVLIFFLKNFSRFEKRPILRWLLMTIKTERLTGQIWKKWECYLEIEESYTKLCSEFKMVRENH